MSKNKFAAPIIISAILILYYAVFLAVIIRFINGIWKVVLGIIPLAISAVMIKVCVERINEIRKGEEDDLGKY